MRRVYLPADARCRQLARMVRAKPGITLKELADATLLEYKTVAAYMVRLEREGVIEAEAEGSRGYLKRFFPVEPPEPAEKQAA